jgi:dTDP-4-amino-4,6-dideoxygalactose transaminase
LIPRFAVEYGWKDAAAAVRSVVTNRMETSLELFPSEGNSDLYLFPTHRGREALYLILKTLGLPAGARVGVPLYACSVVAKTVVAAGMAPIFLDADPDTFGLNLADLKNKAAHLDCLILVYTFGYPSNFDSIAEVMRDRPIIEDCAHSLGSTYQGRPLGQLGDASLFSFGFFKPLRASGGGCIVTRSESLAEKLKGMLAESASESIRQGIVHAARCFLYASAFRQPIYTLVKRFRNGHSEIDQLQEDSAATTEKLISRQLSMRLSDSPGIATRLRARHMEENGCSEFWNRVRSGAPGQWHIPDEPLFGRWNHFMLPVRACSSEICSDTIARLRKKGIDATRIYPNRKSELHCVGYTGDCPEAERLSSCTFMLPYHRGLSRREQECILRAL